MGKPLSFEINLAKSKSSNKDRDYFFGPEGEKELAKRKAEVEDIKKKISQIKVGSDDSLQQQLKQARMGVAMFNSARADVIKESIKSGEALEEPRARGVKKVLETQTVLKEKIKKITDIINEEHEDKEGKLDGADNSWVETQASQGEFQGISEMDSRGLESKRGGDKYTFQLLVGLFMVHAWCCQMVFRL